MEGLGRNTRKKEHCRPKEWYMQRYEGTKTYSIFGKKQMLLVYYYSIENTIRMTI